MQDINPFTLIASKPIYANPWISVREDSVIRPGGKEGIFGVVDIMPGVSVLPIDAAGFVYLTREYKYALQQHMFECVGGGIEHGLTALETAKKELQEEIGGTSTDWVSLGSVYATTVVTKHEEQLFLARNVTFPNPPSPEEGEVIEVVKMTLAEAYELVMKSEIVHGASMVTILKAHILLNEK